MIASIFNSVIYLPLYNALIFLIGIVPGHDVGLAVILLTILVRILVFPIAHKAIKTQMAIRLITPELEELKKKYKDNKEELARKTFALYKERGVRMFAPFQLLLVQIPLLLGLYWVFLNGGLPVVNMEELYSFVMAPRAVNMEFLGIIDMAARSIPLALAAGASQYFSARLTMPKPDKNGSGFQHDLARSMHVQMIYVLPIMIAVLAYTISAAVALYWVTGNLVTIAQEFVVKRKIRTTH